MDRSSMTGPEAELVREELRLQRRAGIKVKLDFDAPQWWTSGLMRYVEGLASPKTISAAKRYIKDGRVLEVSVMPGAVDARVRGSRRSPYSVRIYTAKADEEKLAMIKAKFAERAIFGAMMLAGDMPREVEAVFSECGLSLVPKGPARGRMMCGCSEPDDICKHIMAVLLVLVGAFDRDPFLLLRLRGVDKEDLMQSLTEPQGKRVHKKREPIAEGDEIAEAAETGSPTESLALDEGSSFGGAALARALAAREDRASRGPSAPPMFDFPLWRGEMSYKDSITPYYETVSKMLREK